MTDPIVHLTAGVPDSGDGNITTLGMTLIDGANATIGAKADIAVTAFDATPGSVIALLKGVISRLAGTVTIGATSLPLPTGAATAAAQATAASSLADIDTNTSATAGATAAAAIVLGSKTDAAAVNTDATSISSMSVWKQISKSIQAAAASLAGTLTATVSGAVSVSNFPATQPVSAASLPLPTGAAQDATVSALVSGTDFDTKIGSLTETAPTTDIASSGLNGRLQRVAQRLSSLIALLPSALGAGGGLKVDGSGTALPVSTASLPLPTGAATAANQTTGNASLGDIDTSTAAVSAAFGAKTDAADTHTDATSISATQVWKQISKTLQAAAGAVGTAFFAKITDGTNTATVKAASTPPVAGDTAFVTTISPNTPYPIGMSPKGFSSAFTTLTRPANTTAYTAGNSISNNVTAGSVTALTATVSDTNNDLVTLADIMLSTTDTGAAGKRVRAYLYNSDPTASTGVGAGDGAAFSNKHAGYIGSMSGIMEAGFSDGTVGRLVPSFNDGAASPTQNAAAGGFIVVPPSSGGKALWIQLQAIDGFTPVSASTWIATLRGYQGRAS